MRRRLTSRARAVAGALTLLLVIAWGAPPASAADRTSSPKSSLSTSAAARVAGLKPTARAFQAPAAPAPQTTGGAEGGKSFLSSTTGKIAVVAMAAGLGFAAYSAFHDNNPVHSPIR